MVVSLTPSLFLPIITPPSPSYLKRGKELIRGEGGYVLNAEE